MKLLQDKTNVIAPDGTYEYGSVKDNTGANDGTPADRDLFSDGMQFFERLIDQSGITANGLPDNTVNGYQLYEAFRKLTKPYKEYVFILSQSGTAAPAEIVLGYNTIGSIVWSRTTTGVYVGTLGGAFISNKTWVTSAFRTNLGYGTLSRTSTNTVEVRTFNSAGTPTDAVMSAGAPLEIRVYD